MAITIITVGKLKEAWQRDACTEYMKRLKRFGTIEIKEVPDQPEPDKPSDALNRKVKDAEGKEILAEGGTVICAVGQRSRKYDELLDAAPTVRVIGDAVRPANITMAVYQGWHAGLDV